MQITGRRQFRRWQDRRQRMGIPTKATEKAEGKGAGGEVQEDQYNTAQVRQYRNVKGRRWKNFSLHINRTPDMLATVLVLRASAKAFSSSAFFRR